MISIRRRLTRDLLAVTLLLLGGGLCAIHFAAREEVIEQFDDTLKAKAMAISTLVIRDRDGVQFNFSDRFFRGFDDDHLRDFFQMWTDDGRTFARSESLSREWELPLYTGKRDKPVTWNLELPNHRPGRAVGFAFRPRTAGERARENNPELRLVVASNRGELDETLWELLGISIGCGVLLLTGTLWVIPRVLRRGLRPLDDLGEQVKRIHAGSLATRFSRESFPAELQPVAHRLNELLARLEQSFERERRFSADLAHELRTPLAELRSAAECALKWPETRDPAVDRETLAIAQHMEAIVTHILALARGEQGQLAARRELVALDQIVRDVWDSRAEKAAARPVTVRLALAPAVANGDPALVRSIVVNLCDNAVEYAPAGSTIECESAMDGGRATVRIANDAPELDAGDGPKLFERFWRKESARSGGTHVGLGLCLAQGFAHAMGWTLAAALDEQHRLVFTLQGPLVPDSLAAGKMSGPVMLG